MMHGKNSHRTAVLAIFVMVGITIGLVACDIFNSSDDKSVGLVLEYHSQFG